MYERENYASKAQAGTALGLSIPGVIALANQLFGGVAATSGNPSNCGVNRFELEQESHIARLESQVTLRDANSYAMQQVNDLRNYFEKKFDCVNEKLNAQAVYNATLNATVGCIQNQTAELMALTKRVVPNPSICPGWGDVTVSVTPTTTSAATSAANAANKAA